jgi:3-phenylpropionate/trans-cinnamate dioxygenase ferredoxin reductase subunit
MAETFVIAGASLAGGNAAITLREEGFDGRIILIGAESHPPYERPPLSKQYLRGEVPSDKLFLRPEGFYASSNIETRFGATVRRVDTEAKTVELANGDTIAYDKLLIATGGRNRRPPIPGIDLPGVYSLRTIGDSEKIRSIAHPGKSVVIVGMGFIGCEVAASLSSLGLKVTVIESKQAPLGGILGPHISNIVEAAHREHGVEMHFGDIVTSFEGNAHVERVTTREGLSLDCDFAVFGLGIQPVTDLVDGSGIKVDNGIVVDEFCRTNVTDVFAAGDVANHFHPTAGRHVRVEHWQHAIRHGIAAARSMLGRGAPYTDVHWFWSDQYEINIQYAGFHGDGAEIVTRGRPEERNFITFQLEGGVLKSAAAVNRKRDLQRAIPLIASGMPLDVVRLGDETVDLRSLSQAAAGT